MAVPFRTISRAATVTAAAYPFLPERVATRFDAEGRPRGASSRMSAAVLFPAMMLGLQVSNHRLGAWPGGRDRQERGSRAQARDGAIALIELGLLPAHLAILAAAAGIPVDMRAVTRGASGALLVVLGNVLPKLRRNGLIGIRTPWTPADPTVWEQTHRVGGYLITAAGLVTLASLPARGRRADRLPVGATLTSSTAYSS